MDTLIQHPEAFSIFQIAMGLGVISIVAVSLIIIILRSEDAFLERRREEFNTFFERRWELHRINNFIVTPQVFEELRTEPVSEGVSFPTKEQRNLKKMLAALKNPLSDEIKAMQEQVPKLLSRYKNLRKQLQHVEKSLINNDPSSIEDELMQMEVELPILLIKQYWNGQKWQVVPGCSKVTDKNFLTQWLSIRSIHPTGRDLIMKPELYRTMKTRYSWHELTLDSCTADELHETALQLHDLSNKLATHLKEAAVDNLKTTNNSFFSLRPSRAKESCFSASSAYHTNPRVPFSS